MAELDFILEMGALDEPERFTFLRGGRDSRREATEIHAAWTKVRAGNALGRQMDREGITAANRRMAEYRRRQGQAQGLRPGLTRGGKPVAPDA